MRINLENINKSYLDKKVLEDITIEIKQGTITGIIGPNGSGKSTLMRIVSGLEKQEVGSILFDGVAPSPEIRKQMTLVFQKPYLIHTDVFHNISYPLTIRGKGREEIQEKVEAVIELLELSSIARQNANTLSGGEAQKAALARAIVFEPKLLLLDEPTANIDPQSMLVMEKAIRYINEKNKTTVLLVTHNIRQLQRLCSQSIFMLAGKIEESGETEMLLKNIKNSSLRDFIAEELLL